MTARMHEQNCFEYRWNKDEGHYYLFNPYTGETVLGQNYDNIKRGESMWAKPDKYPSKEAYTIQLHQDSYQSRLWGSRNYDKTKWTKDIAAIIIQSVRRGHLARVHLRYYFEERYYLKT